MACGKYILTAPIILVVLRLVAEGGRKERAIALGPRTENGRLEAWAVMKLIIITGMG